MKYAMNKMIFALCLLLVAVPVSSAQEKTRDVRIQRKLKEGVTPPAGAVAVIESKVVSRKEFVDALYERFKSHSAGRQAMQNLISRKVIAKHLKDQGLEVTEAEVNQLYGDLDQQVQQATQGKKNIDAILKERGMSKKDMLNLLRDNAALKKLAGREFKKPNPSKVEQEQWLRSKTRAAAVVLDSSKLPPDAAAKVHDEFITREEFAGNILMVLDHEEAIRLLEAIMQAKLARMVCEKAGVEIKPGDVDRVYAAIRDNFESDPRYEGLKFADFVQERYGMTPDAHKASANFQREVCITRFGEKTVTEASTRELYEKNRDHFGPIYELRHIIIRGSDDPKLKGKLPSLAEAKKTADDIHNRIVSGSMTFEEAARMFSQDARSKFKDGKWDNFTPARLRQIQGGEAMLALKEKEVSKPLRYGGGYRIIKLQSRRPVPPLSPRVATELRKQTSRNAFNEAWRNARRGYDLTTLIK